MGTNAAHNPKFDNTVKMWVFEEMVNGSKLTEIINSTHENVKYLPGHKLPENVVRRAFWWPVNGPAPERMLLKPVLDLDFNYPSLHHFSAGGARPGGRLKRRRHPDLCDPSPVHR